MKALIAMSGGVDSSVAAKLMKDKGYECIGATMRLYDREDSELPDTDMTDVSCSALGADRAAASASAERGCGRDRDDDAIDAGSKSGCRTCCSETDAADARAVAGRLDMICHTLNYKEEFRSKVIDKFIECYENGATPNPCIDCNRYMKFDLMLKKAKSLGCDKLVTGHYARIERGEDGKYRLLKAKDESKDQSYVLYMLTQEQLEHIEFPMGEYTKSRTRDIAQESGFVNSDKPDSQDICFVPDGDYGAVIRSYTGREYEEGDFVDKEGNVLGRHKGIIGYTLGQRKGLGISADRPLYVIDVDAEGNRVVLGDNEDLMGREAYFTDINWISGEAPADGAHLQAKTRYRQKEQPGTVKKISDDKYVFVFDEPVRAITRGQALVIYDGEAVIGGGTIV